MRLEIGENEALFLIVAACRISSRLIRQVGRCPFFVRHEGFCSMMFGMIAGMIADIFLFFPKGEKNVTFAEVIHIIVFSESPLWGNT